MRKFLVSLLLFSIFTTAKAEYYEDIVEVLKYVETENKPHLVGDNGTSYGVLQIQKACVDDVNRYWGTNYTHQQMFKPSCAEEVTILYMKMGAELFYKKYQRLPTEEELVRNHNGGIYQGYRIKATRKYYVKYLQWKGMLESNINL